MIDKTFSKIIFLIIISLFVYPINNSYAFLSDWMIPNSVFLAQMDGSAYKIITDSLNSGGNDFSGSNSYLLSDTIGENATGISTSTSFILSAGYRNMQDSYISISSESDIDLGSVSGISSDFSTGSGTWTVTTDNSAGYLLMVEATSSPAMVSGNGLYYFNDYTPAGSNPDYNFAISTDESAFGFSPEGDDIVTRFKDNGSVCNSNTQDTADKCWGGFSTTAETVAQSTGPNQPTGTATTIKFRAENGSNHIQEAATYYSTIVITAVTL